MNLVRCEDLWTEEPVPPDWGPGEVIHYLWVVGPHGAVSTWFSDTKAALGRSTGGGAASHSLFPRDISDPIDIIDTVGPNPSPCGFLDGAEAWLRTCEVDTPKQVIEAYDEGDVEIVWVWLTAHYESELANNTRNGADR